MTTDASLLDCCIAIFLSTGCGNGDPSIHGKPPDYTTRQGAWVYGPATAPSVDDIIADLLVVAAKRDPQYNDGLVTSYMTSGWPEITLRPGKEACGERYDADGCCTGYSIDQSEAWYVIWVNDSLLGDDLTRMMAHEMAHFVIEVDSQNQVHGHPDLYFAPSGIVDESVRRLTVGAP